MKKKGELTLNYIILMIIALVVLIVVLVIFREQIGNFVSTIRELITGYGDEATKSIGNLGTTE